MLFHQRLSFLSEYYTTFEGERGGSVVECRTPEREVRGSRPTAAVLCPLARHFNPQKYWLITQEAMAPSRHDWKIVDWDVKPQHNQPTTFDISIIKHDNCLNQYEFCMYLNTVKGIDVQITINSLIILTAWFITVLFLL